MVSSIDGDHGTPFAIRNSPMAVTSAARIAFEHAFTTDSATRDLLQNSSPLLRSNTASCQLPCPRNAYTIWDGARASRGIICSFMAWRSFLPSTPLPW